MEDCLFCRIAAHQESSEVVLEDGEIIVIKNKFPHAPTHLLVMPKKHISKAVAHFSHQNRLYDDLIKKAGEAAQICGLADGNYKIIINGGAIGHFSHEHLHLLGGWPSGGVPELE
jgi:histidine triad (HIT) family protein